ncbi:Aliphatic sulfonates import ATP-binding protein SsuB [Sporomusa silvacetica DSM 10669]|uniref:Aliphatic sulfonates import ATP-binding protein SsuB n=1 Tax=Sporomusa silvacetica DSM 10669 TaxID=1123289 RepID=A0ABZ3ISM9_9FIRM|nr:ABC transporter ATP-binding protein [Sporomusa silvacetica]OZC15307.1 aliphatic sulfonates import ATP-binding protein SsuB [Sporomusa silvacetica DSM 10669]
MAILVHDVRKSFHLQKDREIIALNDVSLGVEDQEFVCLLGPSGCGKSTLLKIIAGLEQASSGWVEIDGQKITAPSSDRAIVFQDYALFPWRTVVENVQFGLDLRKVPAKEARKKALEYLSLVNLCNFANVYPHQLSGGMKQRVAIARALVLEPKILLLDEPFGALDAFTRMQLQFELTSICKKNSPTVIFVTHDIDEAIYLGDRVVIMTPNPGKVNAIVNVQLPKPRNRTDYDFNKIRDRVFREFSLVTETSLEYVI